MLGQKPHILVLSKRDLLPEEEALPDVDAPDALRVVNISSAAGQGLEDLKEMLWSLVQEVRASEVVDEDDTTGLFVDDLFAGEVEPVDRDLDEVDTSE